MDSRSSFAVWPEACHCSLSLRRPVSKKYPVRSFYSYPGAVPSARGSAFPGWWLEPTSSYLSNSEARGYPSILSLDISSPVLGCGPGGVEWRGKKDSGHGDPDLGEFQNLLGCWSCFHVWIGKTIGAVEGSIFPFLEWHLQWGPWEVRTQNSGRNHH